MFLRYIFIGPPHKFLQVKGNLIVLPFCSVIQFVIVLAGFPLSICKKKDETEGDLAGKA